MFGRSSIEVSKEQQRPHIHLLDQLCPDDERTFRWKVIIQYLSSSSDDERLSDFGELSSAILMTVVVPLEIVLDPLSHLSLMLQVLDPSRWVSRIVD